jgi:septum formation protein
MPLPRPRLILASRSPRRAELLRAAGYEFEIVPADESVECGLCSGQSPQEFVARLAHLKAANVAQKIAAGLIVACDTVADIDGRILGKPANERHACQMLQTLSGREHYVHTGVCLWRCPEGNSRVEVDTTRLRMDELSEDRLQAYLESGEWAGKAGAFGYQDRLGWVHVVAGSESNVVGLPLERLAHMLSEFPSKPSG